MRLTIRIYQLNPEKIWR